MFRIGTSVALAGVTEKAVADLVGAAETKDLNWERTRDKRVGRVKALAPAGSAALFSTLATRFAIGPDRNGKGATATTDFLSRQEKASFRSELGG
ncbi:hypothetical protein OE88DRAFT_1739041 [Heliocybe sulcata]|uniref:Uncharacterized protein n=1 Tax=Heliocybe sulcata TaxID=5364 RepID=A0A5C3MNG8_9AGAM|nr:hypothetical protein OE88DRAFT_1739041 [Heliocybe sulcata]